MYTYILPGRSKSYKICVVSEMMWEEVEVRGTPDTVRAWKTPQLPSGNHWKLRPF